MSSTVDGDEGGRVEAWSRGLTCCRSIRRRFEMPRLRGFPVNLTDGQPGDTPPLSTRTPEIGRKMRQIKKSDFVFKK